MTRQTHYGQTTGVGEGEWYLGLVEITKDGGITMSINSGCNLDQIWVFAQSHGQKELRRNVVKLMALRLLREISLSGIYYHKNDKLSMAVKEELKVKI